MSFRFIRSIDSLIDHQYYYGCDEDITYLPFDYNKSKYAVQKQLIEYITAIQIRIETPCFSEISPESRRQRKESFIPKGECAYLNQSLITINNYFEKNKLSIDKFLQSYPNYRFIFDTNNSTWERFKFLAGSCISLEIDIQDIQKKKKYYLFKI